MNALQPITKTTQSNNLLITEFKGFDDVKINLATKRLNELSFFDTLIENTLNFLFSKKRFVEINKNMQPLQIKVADLAKELNISKKSIIESDKKNELENLIHLALEAKHHHVDIEVFVSASQQNTLEELRYLSYLSDSLHVPLTELLEAQKKGNLADMLKRAQETEAQVQHIFSKLDSLNSSGEEGFVTKEDQTDRIKMDLSDAEMNSIKSVIRIAFHTLARTQSTASSSTVEMVLPITKNHTVIATSAGNSLKLIGLFGKVLGFGGLGVAIQRLNLLNGEFETDEDAVIKIPMASDEDSEQILQEARILDKIHEHENVLGIQKRLKVVKNVFKGIARHCHVGDLYQNDLNDILFDEKKKKLLTDFEKFSIAYQLIYAVNHLHSLDITHGDIKPKNVFCHFDKTNRKDESKTRVYLADFGGAIEHRESSIPFQENVTDDYRLESDDVASKEAYQRKDLATYMNIEKKADVFAISSVICSVLTNEIPYEGSPARVRTFSIKPQIAEKLLHSGLSPETVELLIKGLSIDHRQRPDSADLLKAISNDLNLIAPDNAMFQQEKKTAF